MYRGVTWRTVLCLAAMLSCASPARADYEAGQTAWQVGRHVEALSQWRAAARTGDGDAMLALGRAFAKGLGIPQDYVLAHMWLNLAAGRGSADAARERDALAANMIPQHIAAAQERARAWLSGRRADAPKAAAVPSAAPPSTPAGPPPPRAIREAQGLMAALGYDPGAADGRWGPRTGGAYTAFLRDAGLPPAEMLTPESLRAMRAAAKGRKVSAATTSPTGAPALQRQADPPPTDLHRLVAAGDIDGLKAALATGADANARDSIGWTALMHAADKGRTLLVPPLLKAGANPNIRASDGATALFMAAVHGHSEVIALLMNAGADFSIKGPQDRTAADVARIRYGGLDAVRRNKERAEVLALVRKGVATTKELQGSIEEKKSSIVRTFRKCKGNLKYYSTPNEDVLFRVTKAMFSNDALYLEYDLGTESVFGEDIYEFKENIQFRIGDVAIETASRGDRIEGRVVNTRSKVLIVRGDITKQIARDNEVLQQVTVDSSIIACDSTIINSIVRDIKHIETLNANRKN